MGAVTSRDYWQRRFLVLAAGLAGFYLAAWGVSEALRVSPAPPRGTVVAAHIQRRDTPEATATTAGTASRPGTTNHPSQYPSPRTSQHPIRPAFCARRDIVLSLVPAQTAFGSGQTPSFSLSVVSTQKTACSFNLGPAHLALVIKEGPARIWSSADCARPNADLITVLARGVPTDVTISWPRETSAPGCPGPAQQAPAGVYTGYAVNGTIVSAPVTFRLG
jgi:hypothetical protein